MSGVASVTRGLKSTSEGSGVLGSVSDVGGIGISGFGGGGTGVSGSITAGSSALSSSGIGYSSACKRGDEKVSAITEHAWQQYHSIKWEEIRVVGRASKNRELKIKGSSTHTDYT